MKGDQDDTELIRVRPKKQGRKEEKEGGREGSPLVDSRERELKKEWHQCCRNTM